MDDDQQYCLRWNNHQSTLISVFDTLLENETLVDCTLAAEGKILKAHKVVLSACSPYFATLLQEQYDKHPVFILKDVKYQELRAMMDYMYRGEVNISQDQLAALLKAAESLQIKGLSDNRAGSSAAAAAPKPEPHLRGKMGGGYTLEQTKRARMATGAMDPQDVSGSREGSSSPSRRRRKVRRRSMENDAHDNSNSSVMQAAASNQLILQQSNAASTLVATQMPIAAGVSVAPGSTHTSVTGVTAASQGTTQQQVQPLSTTSVNKKTESAKGTTTSISTGAAAAQQSAVQTGEVLNAENVQIASSSSQGGAVIVGAEDQDIKSTGDKANHKQKLSKEATLAAGPDMVIEPKAEYDDEGHEETVEDLTLDDEEMGMEELDQTAGTSQGGEGSSQGYAAWPHDRSQEELLLASQEAQQRDPQVRGVVKYETTFSGFKKEENLEERFPCEVCGKSYLRKRHLQRHTRDECVGIPPRFSCELCPSKFRRKYHMVRHLMSKHGIPQEVAQLAQGSNTRTSNNNNAGGATAAVGVAALIALGGGVNGGSSCASADNVSIGSRSSGSHNGCNSPIPENLSMRKDHRIKMEPMSLSPRCLSPLPPHLMPLPTYGLTGAITAISAAAAVVEEQAAAAATAAAIKNSNGGPKSSRGRTSISAKNKKKGNGLQIKTEPVTTPAKTENVMGEEWKMNLGLQFISNSLLKERLMSQMEYAYKNN